MLRVYSDSDSKILLLLSNCVEIILHQFTKIRGAGFLKTLKCKAKATVGTVFRNKLKPLQYLQVF